MKKVGIITFHFADNFGAVLQAYALLRTLQGKNIHVEIINYIPQELREFYNIFFDLKKSVISLGLVKTIKKLLVSVKTLHTKTIKIKNFEKFRNEHLSFSEYLYTTSEELLKKPPIYDVYVTGSDQIWNPDFFTKIGGSYFLDFAVKNADKVSYAASIAKPIESRYFEYYKNYLQSFNYISVRENTAKNELKNIINKDVYIVLDPTLLLEKEDWEKIATYDTVIGEKYILV